MPKGTPGRVCRECGAIDLEGGVVSKWSGLCIDCGIRRVLENVIGLHRHEGPALLRWRRGVAAAVGGVLVDDNREQE